MSGLNRLKRGRHWSRMRSRARTPAAVNARLIRLLCRLPDHKPPIDETLEASSKRRRELDDMRVRLLEAVAMARHDRQEAARRQANMADCKRQLKAMLKMDDAGLARAIEDCDTTTRAAISAAENTIMMTPEARWVPSDDPDAMPGTQMLSPETVRRSVAVALDIVKASKAKRGRPELTYQHNLARACLVYWSACQPEKAPGRTEFVRAVFEAAEWRNDKGLSGFTPENGKNLERLMSKAAREAAAGMEAWDRLCALLKRGRIK